MKALTLAAAALAVSAVTPAIAQHVVTTTTRTTHVVTHGDRYHWKNVCRTVHRGHHTTRVCTRQRVRY